MWFQDLFQDKAKNRSVHLGPYPLETLRRDPSQTGIEKRRVLSRQTPLTDLSTDLSESAGKYLSLFIEHREGDVAAKVAPVPEDLERRAVDDAAKQKIYAGNANKVFGRLG